MSFKKLSRILNASPDDPVRIYTAMTDNAYSILTNIGVLSPGNTLQYLYDQENEYDVGYAEYMGKSYDIMRGLMSDDISDYSGDYPIWGWLSRPNPRKYDRINKEGTVLVYAQVPRKRILITDIEKWEHILNGCPLEDDEEYWEHLDEMYEKTLDPKYLQLENLFVFDHSKKYIFPQVCVDKLYKNEVYKTKYL